MRGRYAITGHAAAGIRLACFWAATGIVGLMTGCSQECPIGQEDHDDDPNTACVEGYACGGSVCPHVPWTTQFGTTAYDYGMAGSVAETGHVFAGGTFGGDGSFVRKYDSGGAELWSDHFGSANSESLSALAAAPDGGVCVAGTDGSDGVFVHKYDAGGTRQWSQGFGSPEYERIADAVVDDAGAIYVLGETEGALSGQQSSGGRDVFVRKYNNAGNLLWTRQFGTSQRDLAGGIVIDPVDGGVLVAGSTMGAMGGSSAGKLDAFARKYDAGGTSIWTRQWGTSENDTAVDIDVGLSGRVYVVGSTAGALGSAPQGSFDAYLRAMDASGSAIWTRQFGSPESTEGSAVAVDRHEQVFVAGRVQGSFPGTSSAGDWDAFVRKFDDEGSTLATQQFGSSVPDRVSGLGVDEASNVFLVGTTDGTLSGQSSSGARDVFVAKRLL